MLTASGIRTMLLAIVLFHLFIFQTTQAATLFGRRMECNTKEKCTNNAYCCLEDKPGSGKGHCAKKLQRNASCRLDDFGYSATAHIQTASTATGALCGCDDSKDLKCVAVVREKRDGQEEMLKALRNRRPGGGLVLTIENLTDNRIYELVRNDVTLESLPTGHPNLENKSHKSNEIDKDRRKRNVKPDVATNAGTNNGRNHNKKDALGICH